MAELKVRCHLCSPTTWECAASADRSSFVWKCCVWKSVRSLFCKCLVIQPSRLYFIYLITHITSWQRVLSVCYVQESVFLLRAIRWEKKIKRIPSKYRAMSHMIHLLSVFSHRLRHDTVTQLQSLCNGSTDHDTTHAAMLSGGITQRPVSSRSESPKICLFYSKMLKKQRVCENALVRCLSVSCSSLLCLKGWKLNF